MKRRFIFLYICLSCLCIEARSAQPVIDMTLYNNPVNSNKLEVRLRPSLAVANGAYSAGIFTVRFPSGLGGSLSVFSSAFGYTFAGPVGTSGGYDYYRFQFVQNFVVNWVGNQEYVAAVLEYSNGPAVGGFELITGNPWTIGNNGDFYQELNGLEVEGVFYSPALLEFSGTIKWEHDGTSGLNNATVNLTGAGTGTDQSDANGDYLISIPSTTGNFTLRPVKNINRLNGVTAADVVAIQQHLTNINPITSPYKLVAADINRSNSISSFDATILNQCLLNNAGANNIFNVFWRFVPQTSPLMMPPWGFPEQIDLTGVTSNQTGQNFFAVKIGDLVTPYANPASLGAGEPLRLRVADEVLYAGATVTAEFRADQLADLNAFQMALQFDPAQLALLNIEPLPGLALTPDNFGVANSTDGEIRVVWAQPVSVPVSQATPVFRLQFSVLQSGHKLSEVLRLNAAALPGLAYNSALAESPVELLFSEPVMAEHDYKKSNNAVRKMLMVR